MEGCSDLLGQPSGGTWLAKALHEAEDTCPSTAFYAGLMDKCFVSEERVIPQPGSFYGGWVTSNIVGTPKGAKGTEHW